jgi:hypothetical protein
MAKLRKELKPDKRRLVPNPSLKHPTKVNGGKVGKRFNQNRNFQLDD